MYILSSITCYVGGIIMNKGDIVSFAHYVEGRTFNGIRTMKRWPNYKNGTIYGIVLGYSFIQEGTIKSNWGDEYNHLSMTKQHKVIVVSPLTNGDRYSKPVKVLEEDLTMYYQHQLNRGVLFKDLFKKLHEENNKK